MGKDDPTRSFVFQFFILAVVAVCTFILLAEGAGFHRSEQSLSIRRANPLSAFADARAILSPWMLAFLVATVCACLASAAYDNSFNYYLRDQFGFPTTYNGYIYAAVGILGLVANLTLGLRLQRSRDAELPLIVGPCARGRCARRDAARAGDAALPGAQHPVLRVQRHVPAAHAGALPSRATPTGTAASRACSSP